MYSDEPFPLHYGALGVPETATIDAIRSAWREIARTSHPDHAGSDVGSRDRFRAASDAWSVLRDPEARAAYDAELVQSRMPRCIQCGRPSTVAVCTLCALSAPSQRAPKSPKPPRPPKPPKPPKPPSRPPPPPPPPPIPEEPESSRVRREAAERDAVNRTRVYDDIDQLHAPSGDNLLEALLADAAFRAAEMAPKKRRKKSKLEVKVSPHFTVSLEGETAETLAGVSKNLRLASRILSGITRFFNG